MNGREREDPVGSGAQRIRDQDLLAETEDEAANAVREIGKPRVVRDELRGNVAKANDRTGDQLREKEDVERECRDTGLRRGVALIDVYDVRNRVKCEKGNAEQ